MLATKKKRSFMPQAKRETQTRVQELPTIVSARTGLTALDDAVMKVLPKKYTTMRAALDYVLNSAGLKSDEARLARSVRGEMDAENFVIVVNGRNAKLTDKVADYLVKKEHVSEKRVKGYNALEIEVAAVQAGGYLRY
ncbi:hypothetical protein HY486_01705 [Candidatus Woesearchaeota archaeon]|nr:hypothetical protein [Candidatus Woesearchaeota archaeon]